MVLKPQGHDLMPEFNIDVVRRTTSTNTIRVDAANRQEAQEKALDQAGGKYKELCSTYELDDNNGQNVDEFSDLLVSQLVLACSCSNDHIAHPSYVIVEVTPAMVRSVKDAMLLCQKEGLLKATLTIPSLITWAPVNDGITTRRDMGLGRIDVTKDNFCITAGTRHSDAVVESVDVSFGDLLQHIQDKVPETLVFFEEDSDEQELRERLANDRAASLADEPHAEMPQGWTPFGATR